MNREDSENQVQLWMEKIIRVQSGLLTASAAASQMNTSRKTYYQKERRGLSGMREGLSSKDAGRPKVPVDTEKEALLVQVLRLQEELTILRYAQRVHEVMADDGEKKISA
jgi:hypothetical protein